MKLCNWCDTYFKPSVSYQIYCSANCRNKATKGKILERHKTIKRQKRKSKTRVCAGNCGTILSIYNDDKYCDHCLINKKQVDKTLKEIKTLGENENKSK